MHLLLGKRDMTAQSSCLQQGIKTLIPNERGLGREKVTSAPDNSSRSGPDTTGRYGRGNHESTGLGRERRSEGVMREWEREREA